MSNTISTYSFLPWLRQGIANQIAAADLDPAVKLRATIPVQLELAGQKPDGSGELTQPVTRNVQLFGPGDVVGIESRAIVRTEPRNWITNFEPNFLPFVEFYDEDFPWRYTPAAPDTTRHRLRPWIALVVLKEVEEFEEGKNIKGKPLPFIKLKAPEADVFPPAEQLWAWAHVHVNHSLAASDAEFVSTDMGAVLPKLQALLNANPDLAYSRIVCPRFLEANAPYHAFLIPVFESGRLAGLGLEIPADLSATASAWAAYSGREEPQHYPYYFRWYFRTGTVGDFEYLVRLLQPKPVDSRVGTRDMDVQRPGSNLPGITDPALGGVLKLGGALRVPLETMKQEDREVFEKYDNWAQPYPHPFQEALAALINLADDYAVKSVKQAHDDSELEIDDEDENDPDPLITPPLYGRWHALTERLLTDRGGGPVPNNANWVHDLNLDPRFRVPAGFGTKVVQERQEEFMNAAWQQIGKVLEANRRIRIAQLARAVSFVWHERHLLPLGTVNFEKALALTAPVHKRVLVKGVVVDSASAQPVTVHHQLSLSFVAPAAVSAQMRRMTRPRGRLMQSLPFDAQVRPNNLLARINNGEVSAAPPKRTPPGVVTVKDVSDALIPKSIPPAVVDLLRRFPWLRYAPLVIAALIVLLLLLFGFPAAWALIGAVAVAGLIFLYRQLGRWAEQIKQADAIREENQTPQSVDALPRSPDFVLSEPGAGFTPRLGATDSVEAARFKTGLKDLYMMLGASANASVETARVKLDLPAVSIATLQAINPDLTIPLRIRQFVLLPDRIKGEIGEEFVEAMAYPEFDLPMYAPLKDISSELFLPNLNLIEQNSITLLETNQRFIEAYMVGLNHEFARELLWREYPTDQRGSYFRQFWDVSSFFDSRNLNDEQLRERLKDIPELHRWLPSSDLGDHDHREQLGDKEEEVVLVVRGELLKKYPNTVVYAHKARWQLKDGKIDNTQERRLEELTEAEAENPPRSKVRTPLYEAKIDPDIYFFGFDLKAEEARGGTGEPGKEETGWFFVLKERPGEPRFGLDINKAVELQVWNDLSWEDTKPKVSEGGHIQISDAAPPFEDVTLSLPTGEDEEKLSQHQDDVKVPLNGALSSAEMAYVLYQSPVLVAIHGAEMLPRQ
jgi:hypothetical protein